MAHKVTIFAEDGIAAALGAALSRGGELEAGHRASGYADCLAPSLESGAEAMILQVRSPVANAQNLMCDMELANYYPAVLLFQVEADGRIRYTITDPDTIPLSRELASAFEAAMEPRYACRLAHFRTTAWDDTDETFAEGVGREEALREILRGCTQKEFDAQRKRYALDLKDGGYYAFFWEFRYIEYKEHRSFKDVHNFIGSVLQDECREIIQSFNGGEVFYVRLTLICVILNDLPIKSEAQRTTRFEETLHRLAVAAGLKSATRYLTRRIDRIGDFRKAYESYLREKSNIFFMRDVSVMRSSELLSRRRSADSAEVHRILGDIYKYLRYDLQNPELESELHRLFFEILKPSMDFTMYYYCTSVICSDIARAQGAFDSAVLADNLNPNLLQYSSIEEQYEALLRLIREFKAQSPLRRKTKSTLVMKAMEYIAANYRENITVSDVSAALYISSTYLSQIFKSMLGVSVIQYLINYRLEQAKQLLEETDGMIYAVAEQVGFRDMRHFSKSFKKTVGMTPTEYRRKFKRKS